MIFGPLGIGTAILREPQSLPSVASIEPLQERLCLSYLYMCSEDITCACVGKLISQRLKEETAVRSRTTGFSIEVQEVEQVKRVKQRFEEELERWLSW